MKEDLIEEEKPRKAGRRKAFDDCWEIRVPRRVVLFGLPLMLASLLGLFLYWSHAGRLGEPFEADFAIDDPAFLKSVSHVLGPPLVPGNHVQPLINGVEIFPAMLEAIRAAERSVTLETYIWSSGEVSDAFIDALTERAQAGVKVHVIVDGLGALGLKRADSARLTESGVDLVRYQRDRWYRIKLNINHRTHRKLLVVDGRVGFTGGVCIDDAWLGNAESRDVWRETHFRIEGPAVLQLQGIFADNWLETTSRVLAGEDYFPETQPRGVSEMHCYKSGPGARPENARLGYYLAIAAARKSIRLSHAYFIPDDLATTLLLEARERGVHVEVIVPGMNDSRVGRAASRSRWDPLLEAGVEFHLYQPALYHCKVMIVDDLWVTAGSVNFDNRSFALNDEANFNVLDRQFALDLVEVFEQDKADSIPYRLEDHRDRSLAQKFADWKAGLLRSQF
jgi:cardiolipin synthase A/B